MDSGEPPPCKKDSGKPFNWKLRPTLQLKIKANSWNKGLAENSHELTWRRLFSFQLILILYLSITLPKYYISFSSSYLFA